MRKNQSIKKLMATLLAFVLLVSVMPMGAFTFTASAATTATSGILDLCTWVREGNVLTISGNGKMGCAGSIGEGIPCGEGVTEVIINSGVTSIAACAFCEFSELEKVTMADTVTEIELWAFMGCCNLKEIKLSSNIKK